MTSPARTDDLQVLLDAQYGLATQSQLEGYGYPRSRVRHFVGTGQWTVVLRGVYSLTSGPLTRPMILMAALLYGGGSALLSHRTAGEEWRMVRLDESQPVHITVPYGESAKSQAPTRIRPPAGGDKPVPLVGAVRHPGVVVHRSRAHAHLAVDGLFPRTSKAVTAIDLAVGASSARAARLSLVSSVTNAGIRLIDIRQCLDVREPRRYRKALDDAVAVLADGVQSVLEYHYAIDVEQAHGLPTAARQGPVKVDGRTLFEDVDYSDTGVPLIVRLDGRATHSMREVAFRDRRRDNAAELADRPRLVYGFEEVGDDPCGVAREVETVLVREGWRRERLNLCAGCESVRPPTTDEGAGPPRPSVRA